MNLKFTTDDKLRSNYITFIFISLIFHILIFSALNAKISTQAQDYSEVTKEIKILLNPQVEKKVKKVMVSPSDMAESLKEVESNLLSDKNTSVEKQQIKRGVPEANPVKMNTPKKVVAPVIQKKPSEDTPRKKANPDRNPVANELKSPGAGKDILATISESTFDAFNKTQKNKLNSPSDSQSENEPNSQKASDSAESRLNSIAGIPGNPDLLTGIQDGEITLLNAKADRFAVFVRRVALKVFSALRNSNWYEIGNLQSGFETEEVTIRAVLDKNGKFIKYEILKSSKTDLFDRVLVQSVKKGAWDKNPPQNALAADGTIKFIFQSKAWVRGGMNGRSHQWILLSTGLE